MITQYVSLASEIRELEQILSSIPEDNVIDRMSFESRLKTVREELKQACPENETYPIRLTFRGKPVLGGRGIRADFGAQASALFSDVFAIVMSDANETINERGPIPGKDTLPLIITGTAIGSFGFEFKTLPAETEGNNLFNEYEPSSYVLNKIEALFRLAAEGSDDDVADIVVDLQQRTVFKVYEFLNFMAQWGAWCSLDFKEKSFRFSGLEQIQHAASRLANNNIKTYEESQIGEFQGVLPSSRTFEFRLSKSDTVIRGKIDRAISDPDTINHELLYTPVATQFTVIKVGNGKPKYALASLDSIQKL